MRIDSLEKKLFRVETGLEQCEALLCCSVAVYHSPRKDGKQLARQSHICIYIYIVNRSGTRGE